MDYKEFRISKLREYMITNVIDKITNDKNYQINADMLNNEPNNYSLDKIPTASTIENWIIPVSIKKEVFSFRSRRNYSPEVIINLENAGFFEILQKIIEENNKNKILPDIKGIIKIECLNCASMVNNTTNTAEFDIQIQITYREE